MSNRVCSIPVRLAILSVVVASGVTAGCSGGSGGTTRTTGGTTSFAFLLTARDGEIISVGVAGSGPAKPDSRCALTWAGWRP